MPRDPFPDKIKAAQRMYPADASSAMGVLWSYYEVEPATGAFTRKAYHLLQTKRDEARVEDLVSFTGVKLCEPAVAVKYDPNRLRWVNWGTGRMMLVHWQQHRAWVTRQSYRVSEESLAKFETQLRRKVKQYEAEEKGSLTENQIEPICEALQSLVGQTFNGHESDGKVQNASEQLNAAMRPLLKQSGIVNENGYRDIEQLLKRCTAIGEVDWPKNEDGSNLDFGDPKTDAETVELLSDKRDEVQRRIVEWMEWQLFQTGPKQCGPENAATWFLKHYLEGCHGRLFLDIRRKLCERFPQMQDLLAAVDGESDLRPDPDDSEDPEHASNSDSSSAFGEHVKKITWEHISRVVFSSDEAHPAKNRYFRYAEKSFWEWQEDFGDDLSTEHAAAGDSAKGRGEVPRASATGGSQSRKDSCPVSSTTTRIATD